MRIICVLNSMQPNLNLSVEIKNKLKKAIESIEKNYAIDFNDEITITVNTEKFLFSDDFKNKLTSVLRSVDLAQLFSVGNTQQEILASDFDPVSFFGFDELKEELLKLEHEKGSSDSNEIKEAKQEKDNLLPEVKFSPAIFKFNPTEYAQTRKKVIAQRTKISDAKMEIDSNEQNSSFSSPKNK